MLYLQCTRFRAVRTVRHTWTFLSRHTCPSLNLNCSFHLTVKEQICWLTIVIIEIKWVNLRAINYVEDSSEVLGERGAARLGRVCGVLERSPVVRGGPETLGLRIQCALMLQVIVVYRGRFVNVVLTVLVKHLNVVGLAVRLGSLIQRLLALEEELVVLEKVVLDQRRLCALHFKLVFCIRFFV